MTITYFIKKRSGSVMFMTAAFGVVLLAVTALVTDIGFLYLEQARLQTAVNAGWKAGFDRMMQLKSAGTPILEEEHKQQIRQHVRDVMMSNGYTDEELNDIEIDFPNNNQLLVRHKKDVGLFFAQVMDIRSSEVGADRENLDDLGAIIPLGIPHGITRDVSPTKYRFEPFAPNEKFTVGKEYIIKLGEDAIPQPGDAPWGVIPKNINDKKDYGFVIGSIYTIKYGSGAQTDAGQGLNGNFGALDVNSAFDDGHGGGASGKEYIDPNDGKTYADNYEGWIKYGLNLNKYPGLKIGDELWPETGNMAGPTRDGVEYRIEHNMLDIRIPVVPSFPNGQSSMVKIIGFLNFRLSIVGGSGNNATVTGTYMGSDYAVDNASGELKISYGRIDPDNDSSNASKYLEFFKYGYSAPVEYGQMILPENGNAKEPTATAVAYRLLDKEESPKKVIVPITEVPEEVNDNNFPTATATTIYDLKATDDPEGEVHLASYTYKSSVRVTGFAEFTLINEGSYNRAGENYEDGDNGDLGPVMPGQVRGTFERYIVEPGK